MDASISKSCDDVTNHFLKRLSYNDATPSESKLRPSYHVGLKIPFDNFTGSPYKRVKHKQYVFFVLIIMLMILS